MNAVDTNVLIYSIDAHDPVKRERALALIESLPANETVIPWQVACEVAAVVRSMATKGLFSGDYRETVAALRGCFAIALPQIAVLDRSLEIHARAGVSAWDALLIAACAEAGVTTLYTEDLQSRPVIDGVTFINPFA